MSPRSKEAEGDSWEDGWESIFAFFGKEAVRQEAKENEQIKAQIAIPNLHFRDTIKPQIS
ncbi:MAG: hypothetical protein AB7V04_02170 [Desulfomonilaceae bacterium]